jgi:hypothetical protein
VTAWTSCPRERADAETPRTWLEPLGSSSSRRSHSSPRRSAEIASPRAAR